MTINGSQLEARARIRARSLPALPPQPVAHPGYDSGQTPARGARAPVAPEGRPPRAHTLIGAWRTPARRTLQPSPCSGYSATEEAPVRAGAYQQEDT